MIHNGLEYAEMQLIAEAYQLLRQYCSLTPKEISDIFYCWNESDLSSYLLKQVGTINTFFSLINIYLQLENLSNR